MAAKRVVEALRAAGATLVRPDDHFPPNTPDSEWLPEAGRRGWLIVTLDLRIRVNPLARQALSRSGAGAFVVVGKNLTGQLLADCLLRAWPRMQALARTQPRPFLAKVYADGRVQLLPIT